MTGIHGGGGVAWMQLLAPLQIQLTCRYKNDRNCNKQFVMIDWTVADKIGLQLFKSYFASAMHTDTGITFITRIFNCSEHHKCHEAALVDITEVIWRPIGQSLCAFVVPSRARHVMALHFQAHSLQSQFYRAQSSFWLGWSWKIPETILRKTINVFCSDQAEGAYPRRVRGILVMQCRLEKLCIAHHMLALLEISSLWICQQRTLDLEFSRYDFHMSHITAYAEKEQYYLPDSSTQQDFAWYRGDLGVRSLLQASMFCNR